MKLSDPTSGLVDGFPVSPAGWYCLGSVRDLASGPVKLTLPDGRAFVGYRTDTGRIAVLGGRCCHMGADLGNGCVKGERIVCPLHAWEFGPDGRCAHIPAGGEIPAFARQTVYPVAELGGQVYFFNRAEALHPMPFFDGVTPADLVPARAFEIRDTVAWYLIGGNGFDLQHFRNAHDRVLLAEPEVDAPHPHARRIRLRLGVAGTSPADRLTRTLAGEELEFTVTSWFGTIILARARFKRGVTHGMVSVIPEGPAAVRLRVVVWGRRSVNAVARACIDPLNAHIRRWFIQQFLKSDYGLLRGVGYDPARMIGPDQPLRDYFSWLQDVQQQAHPG